MRLFNFRQKQKIDVVQKLSVFPKISTVVLRVDDKLIVFSPSYLLGKHGNTSREVASKFMNLNRATQLINVINEYVTSSKLKGQKVELAEINFGSEVGKDALVQISEDLVNILPTENVRGHNINTIYVNKGKIPKTNILNIVLIQFNPQFGQGVEQLFKEKYGGVEFKDFSGVYAIVTIYPGKNAPPMSDTEFWYKHALLKELQ